MSIDPTQKPPETLAAFDTYDAFLIFARSLFALDDHEYRGLYDVLVKLEAIGEDPIQTMTAWKTDTCRSECPEFIRFMIHVDNLDMDVPETVA